MFGKYLLAGFGIVLGCILGLASVRYDITEDGILSYAQQQRIYENFLVSHHQRQSAYRMKPAIHFFGASTIQALDVQRVSDNTLNFGIGGETSRGLANRLPLYRSLRTASAVVIQSGFNDRTTLSFEQTRQNYERIFETIPEPIPVFLVTFQPAKNTSARKVESFVIDLNQTLLEICRSEDRCVLIDLYGRLETEGMGILESDALHLNGRGYEAMISLLIEVLSERDVLPQ